MSKRRIGQIRFFGEDNVSFNTKDQNAVYHLLDTNTGVNSEGLSSGGAFESYPRIIQLGIQSLPGTKFTLNSSNDPIIIGITGIYELDLTDTTSTITSLTFDKDSLLSISENPDGYLIIDFIYEED